MPVPRITLEEARLVTDPEMRYSEHGKPRARMRLVTSDRRRTETGTWEDTATCWLTATCWGEQAEHVMASLRKGDLVTVTGRLVTLTWTDEGGAKHSALTVNADTVAASLRFRVIKHADRTKAPASDPDALPQTHPSGGRGFADAAVSGQYTPAQGNLDSEAPPF